MLKLNTKRSVLNKLLYFQNLFIMFIHITRPVHLGIRPILDHGFKNCLLNISVIKNYRVRQKKNFIFVDTFLLKNIL